MLYCTRRVVTSIFTPPGTDWTCFSRLGSISLSAARARSYCARTSGGMASSESYGTPLTTMRWDMGLRAALRPPTLRHHLPQAIPYFRPDVVGELPALFRQHRADIGRVETRHARFRENVLEVDAGFLDHEAQGTGPAAALAHGQRQEVEVARSIEAPGEVVVCVHTVDNSPRTYRSDITRLVTL